MSNRPLCIYHGACDDGFCAAMIVREHFKGEVDLFPGVYGKPPPDVSGRRVIMVDFSYKRSALKEMLTQTRSLLILDHHKSAMEDLAGLMDHSSGDNGVLFDMNRSGAGITWDYFNAKPRTPFVNYIEDRDLWRKKLPGGDEFTMGLRSYPQDVETWLRLMKTDVNVIMHEGSHVLRYFRQVVEGLKKEARTATFTFGTETVMARVVNAGYAYASEVAGEVAAEDGFIGATWFIRGDGMVQYSLRSRGPNAFDCTRLAERFGGGGHAKAAGFQVPAPIHEDIR